MAAPQDQRTRAALARIDRALAHLEAIAAAPPQPTRESVELERLRAAHELLRKRVEGAIGEIDALLADGQDGHG